MDADGPSFRYDARLAGEIERRWQERWDREGTFLAPNPSGALSDGFGTEAGRPKFYLLDFFPYPSGIGLHVGHPLGYIGTDVFDLLGRLYSERTHFIFELIQNAEDAGGPGKWARA
jgi:leucyl-tRNA synthetase